MSSLLGETTGNFRHGEHLQLVERVEPPEEDPEARDRVSVMSRPGVVNRPNVDSDNCCGSYRHHGLDRKVIYVASIDQDYGIDM